MKNRVTFLLVLLTYIVKAQSWLPVGSGLPNAEINALTVYSGNLIAGGSIPTSNNIAQWNGVNWNSLGTGINGNVYALTVYNGKLIAAGQFSEAGGVPVNNIAEWDGSSWSSLGSGIALGNNSSGVKAVYTLCVYKGNLVAAGLFDSAGNIAVNNITQWDGSIWSTLGRGVDTSSNINSIVYTLYAFKNNLWAGGGFSIVGGIPVSNIAQWNGSAWSALNNGVDYTVMALNAYDSNLVVAGFSDTVLTWNGAAWDTIHSVLYGVGPDDENINAMTIYDSNIIVGGIIEKAGGINVNDVAQWNGSNWDSLGSGLSVGPVNIGVLSLVDYNGLLIAGGYIYTSSGTYIGIAQWGSMPTVTQQLDDANEVLTVFPNPSTGLFTIQIATGQPLTPNNYVEVYNMLGESIYRQKLNPSTTEINLSGQPAGIYLYRILDANEALVQSGKVMVEH